MSCGSSAINSATAHIEWTPCGTVGDNTRVVLEFVPATSSTVIAGTFRVLINGVYTGSITYSSTPATLVTSLNTALDATFGAGEFVASVDTVDTTKVAIEASNTGFYNFFLVGSNDTINANAYVRYTHIGTETFVITNDLMSFSYEEQADLDDITPLSQLETEEVVVGKSMTFELTAFVREAQAFLPALHNGAEGKLGIWFTGKQAGSRFTEFNAILNSVSIDGPNKAKLEMSLSGVRKGKPIYPVNSIYNTSV